MKLLRLSFPLIILLIMSCNEDPPVYQEGNAKLVLTVMGDTSVVSDDTTCVPLSNAKVILFSEYGYMIKYTDETGKLILEGIPSSTYTITARLNHPKYSNILLAGNLSDIEIISGKVVNDTIIASQISNTGIAINELYVGGPLNNIFFFYDQFIELYNSSDEVKYLDGMIVTRVPGVSAQNIKAGEDFGNDGDIDGVGYIFKFPGEPGEKNYPFHPKTFLVLAQTAINHQNNVASSIDLSGADWEFYNQYSTSDFDNSSVPNLINMRSDKTVDFLIGLTQDVIVLASGEDSNWEDGIDIDTILDGVEYQGGSTLEKTLDSRVDKSYTLCPAKYGGKSMQRREPGVDTNDGISDWEIIPAPTPGRQ